MKPLVGAGKGSADRVTDHRRYADNFDQIKWPNRTPEPVPSEPVIVSTQVDIAAMGLIDAWSRHHHVVLSPEVRVAQYRALHDLMDTLASTD
jgi:hypothetical protein